MKKVIPGQKLINTAEYKLWNQSKMEFSQNEYRFAFEVEKILLSEVENNSDSGSNEGILKKYLHELIL